MKVATSEFKQLKKIYYNPILKVEFRGYWMYWVFNLKNMKLKKTFVFYHDWKNMIEVMSNEDAGELLKNILSYVNEQKTTSENPIVNLALAHIKPMIDKDLEKWDETRKKRIEYGKKGGLAKAKQNVANAKQNVAVNDNVNVNVNDNVNVNNTSINIDSRKTSFSTKVSEICIQKNFSENLKNEFLDYWTEHGENDKKMRFEKQTSFSIPLRLEKWKKNNVKWKKEKSNKKMSMAQKMRIEYGIN